MIIDTDTKETVIFSVRKKGKTMTGFQGKDEEVAADLIFLLRTIMAKAGRELVTFAYKLALRDYKDEDDVEEADLDETKN